MRTRKRPTVLLILDGESTERNRRLAVGLPHLDRLLDRLGSIADAGRAPTPVAQVHAAEQKPQRDYGDVVGLSLAGERVVLVSDPTVAADVMIDRAELFVKEGTAFFPGSSLAGEGLLVSDGDSWARQRRLSNPAFRKAAVETYANAMASAGLELLQNEWAMRSVRDVYEDFNDLTLRIVAEALFGAAPSLAPASASVAAPAAEHRSVQSVRVCETCPRAPSPLDGRPRRTHVTCGGERPLSPRSRTRPAASVQ